MTVVKSAGLVGIDAVPVDVEVSTTSTLPGIKTVGLPDSSLREGRERVWLALRNSELLKDRPSAIVNLAPAGIRKSGSHYDVATALGLLVVSNQLAAELLHGFLFVGELSLNGHIRPVRGVLSMAALARDSGLCRLVVPDANAEEAGQVEGVTVYPAKTLRELADGLKGVIPFEPYPAAEGLPPAPRRAHPDLSEVLGQALGRRALEIAAAGAHHLLFVGPPGSGKTMLARRLPGILPLLEREEAIDVTRIHSAAGLLPAGVGLVRERPFRAPHHTISSSGLVGGYLPPRPGELSLAHHGVLFLDELGEFARPSLESLREPLETGSIAVTRGGLTARFPTRTILIAATNPCPCGYLGDPVRECHCPLGAIDRYRGRLSGPLLDRIDLHVEIPRLKPEELTPANAGEGTQAVRARVGEAWTRQRERARRLGAPSNGLLEERAVRELVPLDPESRRALERAVEKLGLSPRAWVRILRLARTVADLGREERVRLPHLLEAIQYRSWDRRGP